MMLGVLFFNVMAKSTQLVTGSEGDALNISNAWLDSKRSVSINLFWFDSLSEGSVIK